MCTIYIKYYYETKTRYHIKYFPCFQVCSNGYITLDKPFADPSAPKNISDLDLVLIAPYYAHMNDSGNVFYRTFDILNNQTLDSYSDVQHVASLVRQVSNEAEFEPKYVLIATWVNKTPYQSVFEKDKVSISQNITQLYFGIQ